MGWTFLILEAVISAAFTILLYRRYGSFTKRPVAVVGATIIGWYLAISVVFLIPNDISSTRWELCLRNSIGGGNSTESPLPSTPPPGDCGHQPISYVNWNSRLLFWRILYWSIYVATWLVFPILQPYSMAGEFDFKGKMKRVGRVNLIYWGSMAVIGVVLTLYLIVYEGIDFATLLAVCMALGNAWGLLMLVILLGVGLVEIPRGLWLGANFEVQLNHYRFKVSSLNKKRTDAKDALLKVLKQIKRYDEVIRPSNPMRGYIEIIIAKCAAYHLEYSSLAPEGLTEVSEADLVALHQALMMAEHNVTVTQSQFDNYILKAVELEDVLAARRHRSQSSRSSRDRDNTMMHHRSVEWSLPRDTVFSGTRFEAWYSDLVYFWKVYAEIPLRRIAAVFCAALSVITIWSECVFASKKPVLSIWALLINVPSISDAVLHLFVFVPILYMAVCAFSSMLGLEMWSFYRLVPNGKTDSYSLLFSAGYLLRLFGPISYNFLFLVHYDTPDTAFIKLMGLMDQKKVPIIGDDYFILFFPITVVVVCLAVVTDLHKTILGMFTTQFEYDEDFEHADITDGRQIVDAEKRRRMAARGVSPPPSASHSRNTSIDADLSLDLELRSVRTAGSSGGNALVRSDRTSKASTSTKNSIPSSGHRRIRSDDARLGDLTPEDTDIRPASSSENSVATNGNDTSSIWSRLKSIVSNTGTNNDDGIAKLGLIEEKVNNSSPSPSNTGRPSFASTSSKSSAASSALSSSSSTAKSDVWKLSRK